MVLGNVPLDPGDYAMAGTLNLLFDAPVTYQLSFTTEDIERLLVDSHNYIVTRGPIVRIAEARSLPSAFELTLFKGEEYLGESRMYVGEKFSGKPLVQILAGGRYFVVTTPSGEVVTHGNAWSIAANATQRAPDIAKQEVLYIGKAYGSPDSDGLPTRNTALRTKAHETIQAISQDHLGLEYDIFLTPLWSECRFSWTNDDFIDDDELGPHPLEKLLEFIGDRGYVHRIALAEEALIAYFKPEYNEKLTEWSRTFTVAAQEMRATNLRVLNVTVTNWNGVTLLYSRHVPNARLSHSPCFVVGMPEAEMRNIGRYRWWGDERRGIAVLMDWVDESPPANLVAGSALPRLGHLPDEKDIAYRQGSGKAQRPAPTKRRWLNEMELQRNPN
jgi:hypothetical protein